MAVDLDAEDVGGFREEEQDEEESLRGGETDQFSRGAVDVKEQRSVMQETVQGRK